MKKLAIALVALTCLLAGALLPALAEVDATRPAAGTDAPKVEEKAAEGTERSEKEELPEAPSKNEAPVTPDEEPIAPKATRVPKADGGEAPAAPEGDAAPAAPEEKPDAFEAPRPAQRHGCPDAAHPHGKRHHGEEGPKAGPDARLTRRPDEDERPRHAVPHCRRHAQDRMRSHCPCCPYDQERPGRQDGEAGAQQPDPSPEREARPAETQGKKMTLLLGPETTI